MAHNLWDFEMKKYEFEIFRKKSERSHLLEIKKLGNDIQDQISSCKSVGVRNRP